MALEVMVLAAMTVIAAVPPRCPDREQVERRLRPLLSPEQQAISKGTITLVPQDGENVMLILSRPDGAEIARKLLPPNQSCDERAETAAVMAAAWQAQIHPQLRLTLPSGPRPVATLPASAVVREAPAASPPFAMQLAVGAAAIGAWQPASLTPGAQVDLKAGARSSDWSARLSLIGVATHETTVPPGRVEWRRLYAVLAVVRDIPLGARGWMLAASAGALAGAITMSGVGYSMNRSAQNFDLGAEATLRILKRFDRVQPWLGIAVDGWTRRQTIEVTGESTTSSLPRLQPRMALGIDFVIKR
jgi:hypothetical protein